MLNENKTRLRSVIVFCDCVAHQHGLNEMRRGWLLCAVAKCSSKCLSGTHARELTGIWGQQRRLWQIGRRWILSLPKDEWVLLWRIVFKCLANACSCLCEAPKGPRSTQTSLRHGWNVVKSFWVCWNVESSMVIAAVGLTGGHFWRSVNPKVVVWYVFLSFFASWIYSLYDFADSCCCCHYYCYCSCQETG